MDNKKELKVKPTGKGHIIFNILIYSILVFFMVYNGLLCRLCYGFFGVSTAFVSTLLSTICIFIIIIFLSIKNRKKIFILRFMGVLLVTIYPIVTWIAKCFSLFEFEGIGFNRELSMVDDTTILINIPVLLLILIITAKLNKNCNN